ncbi:rod shape-determining protein [Sulfuriferula plumbiphila]|uniref:Rod shape-determining protein n=1 Tax=Sulfuriferula plumbiphila TaxID=171865 RepID=A0A512L3H0_9PROT|nr:rod shape-determining protein MreD [Sulfuriferula plumbiphila]BBP02698.1 rod shape-determining protein [Sulfuriferula plumbiphila]GEP28992.1 rod shape-determining protein [Sulfuriferula plumbiphila]
MSFVTPKGPTMPVAARTPLIVISLLAGLALNLLPWMGTALWWRPDFLLVIMLYWVVQQPRRVGMGAAWGLGLLTDLANGGVLGQHAMAYTVAAFGALLLQRRILNFNLWQQTLQMLPLLLAEQLTSILAATFAGHAFSGAEYFLAVPSGTLLWLPVSLLLQWPRQAPRAADAS